MIARTDTGPLAEAMAETARLADNALHVVATLTDCDLLTRMGFDAVVAGQLALVVELASSAADVGRPVLLVGSVGAAVRDPIRRVAPHANILRYAKGESVAQALCIDLFVRTPTDEELVAAAATWRQLVADGAREDVAPTADRPLDEDADYVPPPVDALPPACREFVGRGAKAQGVDPAFFTVPLLGVLAGAIGSTRRVLAKRGWREPAVLWTAPIGPSGCGKSPALEEVAAPLVARNRELQERSEVKRAEYDAEREARRGDHDAGGPPPTPPPSLRCTLGDATLEALAARHKDNPRGVVVLVDELHSWVAGFDKYRKGGDAAQWLSLHSGKPLQVDRSGPGSMLVVNTAVSVVGTIQPAVARRIIATSENRQSGLAARLLVACPPLPAGLWTDECIPDEVRSAYHRVVNGLLDLTHGPDGEPINLNLSDAARARFIRFANDSAHAYRAAHRDGDHDVASAIAKLKGGALRIALVLCLARHAEDGTAALAETIEDVDMAGGIRLAQWFEYEARRLYSRWSDAEAQDAAGRERGVVTDLANLLAKHLPPGQRRTLRELHAAMGNNLLGKTLRAALAVLVATGRARQIPPDRSKPGRPAEVWEGLDPNAQGVTS